MHQRSRARSRTFSLKALNGILLGLEGRGRDCWGEMPLDSCPKLVAGLFSEQGQQICSNLAALHPGLSFSLPRSYKH